MRYNDSEAIKKPCECRRIREAVIRYCLCVYASVQLGRWKDNWMVPVMSGMQVEMIKKLWKRSCQLGAPDFANTFTYIKIVGAIASEEFRLSQRRSESPSYHMDGHSSAIMTFQCRLLEFSSFSLKYTLKIL